ncbi:hypothetical protein [Listeria grandensis]|uniref:hypothetical protein n=1 Tax=Listeria grandensis TaxID=1494963 RepID=UPI00164EBB5F|nr:hypothetical protein [Listeria grandensis]MBC6316165.1 hypothetical protein [Listeria grandensis]
MKKVLSRWLVVLIVMAMIVSTIPAYEPYAEQEVPPAETTVEGTPEKTDVVEEKTEKEQQDTQVAEVPSVKEDGDWTDPYYEGVRRARSVADKPEKATIKTVSNGVGTGTGAMNLSWKAMPGATGYKVIIGNGYNYEYFSVGNVTSWTTKGKGIFPTKAELDKGLYRFHTDGKGMEFANDPTQLYENTFKAGTTWTLRGQKKYIVRILAIYASGDGPTSDITEAVMPPETLPAKPEKSTIKTVSSGAGTGTGHMDISWQAVAGAIDYKVVISNGYNYEYFNTGNVTNWSTKGKKIFPTQAEIANKQYKFHQDGKGVEFASDPRALYENGYQAGSTFGLRNQKKYIVRILAVYPWGDGPTSDITDATMPMEQMTKPTVTSHRTENDKHTGYLNVDWKAVPDAVSYKIGLFNGYNYQYVNVGKTTNWSTKGKKLWASNEEIANGNYQLHVNGTGSELPMDPMKTYTAANKENPKVNYSDRLFYYIRVIAVFENGESPVSDAGTTTMPFDSIPNLTISVAGINQEDGLMDVYWDEMMLAAGYKFWIFNGLNYIAYDVKKNTEWHSENQFIWPTKAEIAEGKGILHMDNTGENLSLTPSEVYALNSSNYAGNNAYFSRVTAYDDEGKTIAFSQNETVSIEPADETIDPETQAEYEQVEKELEPYLIYGEDGNVMVNSQKLANSGVSEITSEVADVLNTFSQSQQADADGGAQARGWKVYGNWCGPKHGGGKPIDYLDSICKSHDLCYADRGYFACSCDKMLIKRIDQYAKKMKWKERLAAYAVKTYFKYAPCKPWA